MLAIERMALRGVALVGVLCICMRAPPDQARPDQTFQWLTPISVRRDSGIYFSHRGWHLASQPVITIIASNLGHRTNSY